MNVAPTVPALTLAVLVRLRSALTTRDIVTLLVLLPGVGSAVVLVMAAALVMEPAMAVATTLSVKVPEPPDARLANVSVTPPVDVLTVPELATALTSVRPAAVSESVRVMFWAVLGPALPNRMTYVKVTPAVPDVTLVVLVMLRSELVSTVSVSAAEHTPAPVQDVEGLLFTTDAGGVMVAMLVTDVCACATSGRKRHSMTPANAASNARAVDIFSRDNCPQTVAPNTFKTLLPQFFLSDLFTHN